MQCFEKNTKIFVLFPLLELKTLELSEKNVIKQENRLKLSNMCFFHVKTYIYTFIRENIYIVM